MGGVLGGPVDFLGGGLVVGGGGFHYVFYVFLRVAVVEGEPGALDGDHDAVAFLEDVVGAVETEFEFGGLVGGEGLRVGEAFRVAAAEDFCVGH